MAIPHEPFWLAMIVASIGNPSLILCRFNFGMYDALRVPDDIQ